VHGETEKLNLYCRPYSS